MVEGDDHVVNTDCHRGDVKLILPGCRKPLQAVCELIPQHSRRAALKWRQARTALCAETSDGLLEQLQRIAAVGWRFQPVDWIGRYERVSPEGFVTLRAIQEQDMR